MDIAQIMDLIVKAAGVVNTVVSVGGNAAPAIKILVDLATGAQTGEITDAELEANEAALDALIDKFNAPLK